jgi:hypothetical protein
MTLSINDTKHNNTAIMLSVVILSVVMLRVVMPSVVAPIVQPPLLIQKAPCYNFHTPTYLDAKTTKLQALAEVLNLRAWLKS